MALVERVTKDLFNLDAIKEGDLVYVESPLWEEPKTGIVLKRAEDKIVIIQHPRIANVTLRFTLDPGFLEECSCTVRWSSDLVDVNEYIAGSEGQG